jgi:hypothetical protein
MSNGLGRDARARSQLALTRSTSERSGCRGHELPSAPRSIGKFVGRQMGKVLSSSRVLIVDDGAGTREARATCLST